MYEGRVHVEYHDLAQPEEAEAYKDLLEEAHRYHIPFPLVAIDGEVRLAGGAEFYQIKPLVDEALEARGQSPDPR
ncbi:MAG: hypothetical protein ACP5UM_01990 [Anaerolineae bacterium]